MDTPADFALERLTGVMHFLSTDGRLTRLERGVTGRVFGLLTITSLPRRLILDFSDLFRNDFEYDRIEGGFAIENGHAHTDDLFMESDTARFEIVGRTGLVSEDYDKLVTVIPKISSSLPFVPLWLAQKILNRNVFDKAFSYQYTITGAWDEPVDRAGEDSEPSERWPGIALALTRMARCLSAGVVRRGSKTAAVR